MAPPAGEPPSPLFHDAPTPHFFEVLDDEVEALQAHADAGEGEPEAAPQVGEPEGAEPGARASRLYVLTDAMMVEDQPSLPLGMGDEPPVVDEAEAMRQALAMPEPAEPEPGLEDEGGAESVPLAPTASGEQPDDEAVWAYGEEEFGAEPEAEAEAEPGGAITQAPAWDADDVQALVDQVTDDVCSAMAEQLPEMIRRALDERLSAFIEAHIEQQDTGPQA